MLSALASSPGAGAERQFKIVFGDAAEGVFGVPNSRLIEALELAFRPAAAPLPQKLVVNVPTGYKLDLGARPGTSIAYAVVSLVSANPPTATYGDGELLAQDPARYAADPVAQACAPGTHAAVWSVSLSIASEAVQITIFVDRSTAAGVAYTLQACPTGLSRGSVRAATLHVDYLDALDSPRAPGRYLWRAFVTPADAPTYEMQAVLPLPESLTLKARYDTKRKIATLSGKVLEAAKPVAGAEIGIFAKGRDLRARTDAKGNFTSRIRVTRTTPFDVSVAFGTEPCTGASTAPGGCINAIIVPPANAYAAVWVSVRGGAVRAVRKRDQARAERANVAAADLPASFQAITREASTCLNPRHEADLTITGESTIAFLHNGPGEALVQVHGLVRVYATEAQARAAFAREAVAATAKCELKGTGIPSKRPITTMRLPGLTARSRVLHGRVNVGSLVTDADAEFVFLQRGRATARVRFLIQKAPKNIERTVAAKVAARMG
jgi:hypothetical protein